MHWKVFSDKKSKFVFLQNFALRKLRVVLQELVFHTRNRASRLVDN